MRRALLTRPATPFNQSLKRIFMSQTGFHVLRSFETTNGDLVLRRYMEKWKFLNLLTSKSLYFAPASQFLDNLEGHYTHLDETLSDQQARQWHFSRQEMEMARNARASGVAHNQKAVVICCWTQGIEENPNMWSEYGGSSEAVALETTVARLRQSLGDSFLIVPVKYLDFSHKKIPSNTRLCHSSSNRIPSRGRTKYVLLEKWRLVSV